MSQNDTPNILTLGDVVDSRLPEGCGVMVRLPSGRWSKPFPFCGSMWRERSTVYTFVSASDRMEGRRYLPDDTEAQVVKL